MRMAGPSAALLTSLVFAFGCLPDGTPPTADAGGSPPTTDAGGSPPTADAGDPPVLGPVDSCEEIDADACFSNDDCASERRCEDVGPEGEPVPCCVPGERGDVPGGEPCDPDEGQLECASGVCIQGDDTSLCSETCEGDDDCPVGMQRCTLFPFGDTDFQWCFPE